MLRPVFNCYPVNLICDRGRIQSVPVSLDSRNKTNRLFFDKNRQHNPTAPTQRSDVFRSRITNWFSTFPVAFAPQLRNLRRTTVPVQKPAIRLIATLAIFMSILFATGTQAAAADNVLHSFNINGADGADPQAGLIFDAAGNLYGTTARAALTTFRDGVPVDAPAGGAGRRRYCIASSTTDGANPQPA